MTQKYPPINPKYPHFLHGGGYNPDQWRATPEIWDEDMRLMKLAHCTAMSVGIFAWAALEPEEGRFEFGWLDRIMDMLAETNAYAVLATPSGSYPAWMAQKYPQVLRVQANRVRNRYGRRHNHCFTSPLYREKVRLINTRLAERYKDHPALLVWHVSDKYRGECHCSLCQEAFRQWLQHKYEHDLGKLNHAWWTAFWSHAYTDWCQLESPAPHGEMSIHGLNLDWKRFVTDQTVDFMKHEIAPLREHTPDVPVTTNFTGTYPGLNYWKFVDELDVISLENYPRWHGPEATRELATESGFRYDLSRALKGGKPFMLMESTPSMTNWMPCAKNKRPGMHLLSSLQAVSHGADTVQYFQWRKSRGGAEKFHGAVLDHCGHEHTRVFRDVAEVGHVLEKLDAIIGTTVRPDVAVIFDWENRWALDDAKGPRRESKDYLKTCLAHYHALWRQGIPMDVIDMNQDFSRYTLLIAPMLYMVRAGVAERVEAFVKAGGTFVTTYWSGIVDENDLCFLGGFPGPLRKVMGIWAEEIDALYAPDRNAIMLTAGNGLGFSGEYEARDFCDLIHAETAMVLAMYKADFYAGYAALTVNTFGEGHAYYIASRNEQRFLNDFYSHLAEHLHLQRALQTDLPEGVAVQMRTDGENTFLFVMNFSEQRQQVQLGKAVYLNFLTGEPVQDKLSLAPNSVMILQ